MVRKSDNKFDFMPKLKTYSAFLYPRKKRRWLGKSCLSERWPSESKSYLICSPSVIERRKERIGLFSFRHVYANGLRWVNPRPLCSTTSRRSFATKKSIQRNFDESYAQLCDVRVFAKSIYRKSLIFFLHTTSAVFPLHVYNRICQTYVREASSQTYVINDSAVDEKTSWTRAEHRAAHVA